MREFRFVPHRKVQFSNNLRQDVIRRYNLNMASNYVLYELAFSDGTFYIGMSYKFKRRLKEHRAKWKEPFTHQFLLERLSRKDAFDAEIKWISYYPTIGKPIRNLSEGGRGCRPVLESTRKRMSAAKKGKRVSPETRERMSKAQKGLEKKYTPISRAASTAGALKACRQRWDSLSPTERSEFAKRSNSERSRAALLPRDERSVGTRQLRSAKQSVKTSALRN